MKIKEVEGVRRKQGREERETDLKCINAEGSRIFSVVSEKCLTKQETKVYRLGQGFVLKSSS